MSPRTARNRRLLTEAQLQARIGELYAAIDQFNRGWYFESHETLEDLWLAAPEPDRTFLQGIIQLAAAFVHVSRGEGAGVGKLLESAERKLRPFEPDRHGVDVTSLLSALERVRAMQPIDQRTTGVVRVMWTDLSGRPEAHPRS